MAPRTKDARDIIDKLHPRRPRIILHTRTIPIPIPLVLSTSKNTNTLTFSFTMAATDVMLPQNVRSLSPSSTETFGTRDYEDPLVVQRQFDRLQGSVDGLEERFNSLETEVTDLKTEVADLKTEVADLKTEVTDLKTQVADLKTEVTDLKTQVDERFNSLETEVTSLKTQVETGFAQLKAMILGLGVQVPQPAGPAPHSVQGAQSSLSDEHRPEDGPPPSSVLPDPEHISPPSSIPRSLDEGSPSVQGRLPSLEGNSPSPSIEAPYSASPVLFAPTYAESSEEAGPSVVILAQHVEETIDTAKQEIGTLKRRIASMLSLRNLKK